MSAAWVFKNGVFRLVENLAAETVDGDNQGQIARRRKVLVHTESNKVITSYDMLESKLRSLGWERYYGDPDLLQFHKYGSVDLISFPKDFSQFKSPHMYDIVVKNVNAFQVRET